MKDNPLEKDIESKVCAYARSRGAEAYKFTSPSHAGVCDRVFIFGRRVFWIEFKRRGEKPTALQSRHHQTMARHGQHVYVVDSVEQGKEIVDHETQQTSVGPHKSAIRYIGGDQGTP